MDAEVSELGSGIESADCPVWRTAYQLSVKGEGTHYRYNRDHQLLAIHYPDGGTERFIRDGAGNRIKHILPEQYDPATDDGAGYGYTYDAEDRLAHQVLEDRENDIRLLTRFSYDRGGNLIQVVQQGREGQRELSCTYDLKDRLTGVKELGGPVFGYGYDRNDNRIQQKRRLPLAQEAYAVTRYHYDLRGTWWARKKGEACGQNTPMMLPATGPKAGMGTG